MAETAAAVSLGAAAAAVVVAAVRGVAEAVEVAVPAHASEYVKSVTYLYRKRYEFITKKKVARLQESCTATLRKASSNIQSLPCFKASTVGSTK